MPEKLDSIHQLQNLGVCLVLNAVVHSVVKKVIIIVLVIHTDILVFIKIARRSNIGLLISIHIENVLLRVFGLINFLKFALNHLFFFIKNLYNVISWHPANKRPLLNNLQRLLVLV